MKKVLFVATVVGHINAFHIPYLKWFKEQGWETHVAAHAENEQEQHIIYCDIFHEICFTRSPFTFSNVKAYIALKKIIAENDFDIIHCHTPVGGALTRLAAKDMRSKGHTKVIYTAHGFHFYKGAPLLNWLVYYPIEKYLSRYADMLITINKEDYAIAKNKMHAKRTEYVPGVGIDVDKINNISVDKNQKRRALGIPVSAIVLLSVGELNKNKNHEVVIRAIAQLKRDDVIYVICGRGILEDHLKKLAQKLGIIQQTRFLGFRADIIEIAKVSDIFVLPSLREGLPVAMMEAMACGLPVICSNVRGCSDLVNNCQSTFLVSPHDINSLIRGINSALLNQTRKNNYSQVIARVDIKNITQSMQKIYFDIASFVD